MPPQFQDIGLIVQSACINRLPEQHPLLQYLCRPDKRCIIPYHLPYVASYLNPLKKGSYQNTTWDILNAHKKQ